ncbi:protein bric-a-brac 2 isoform X1 [Drosophila santomea]|uniref:protein bric-a-brac 2 isoform X1 n=1 Tax=Drosophila santomea TaxID=129105 RepID=UPI0019530153|nr:protein bric-a-brac 2 isoform X1 [Drosophila santomea]XP_039488268.1 protein bric-a-brac 2 isoform X1 [Drosophila santomea]
MDMTKQIADFEIKSELIGEMDQFEPSDYTMAPPEEPKMAEESQLEHHLDDQNRKYSSPERELDSTLVEQSEVVGQTDKDAETGGEVKSAEKVLETELAKPKASLMNDQALTPPPRPLTSSEVVGLRDPEHTELRMRLEAKKSRSLPVSPQPQSQQSQSLKIAGSALFEFGQRSSPVEAKIKANPETKAPRRKIVPPTGEGDNQQFCLRWNNYQSNLTNVFDELLQSESFVDVTLSCEGHSIKAHKMVLSACSPYFQALFYDNPCQHPIIIMRDVSWSDLKALVEFMYKGEINVCQDQINPLLKVAETLKIRGLAEVSAGRGEGGASALPMSAYDDEDEEEELASATAILRQEDDADPDEEMKAKRPRLLPEGVLDLNQRQRKRSRDGSYATPSPSLQGGESEISERGSSATPGQNQSQPLAMTTSTIVRNPFASPNPQTLEGRNSALNAAASQRKSPAPAAGHSNGNSGAVMHSPPGGVAVQSALPPHMAAIVPPPPSAMHHHAQQLAAQHQLAHSHAMASALAAAAAGAGAAGGAGSGSGSGASAPTGGTGVAGSASGAAVGSHHDDMEIKPEIAEMIREEERAKMIESGGHGGWMGAAAAATGAASVAADSYQYQLQSMWQKCWNTNQQNLVQQLRFRERGPLKSWRPEAMAEAIFSVLKEGLSLSQAARKFDIPYPTFVLYANRVHNMLGPSLDGGADPRPKARGRPQRILLGMWPEELIRSVIKAVVFRDYREIKEDMSAHQYANGQAHGTYIGGGTTTNGYHSAAAAKLAAQNAALAPPDAGSPLSSMTETLRRQILSQQQQQQQHHQQQAHHQQQPSHHQQQSPHAQSMNMYKSPAYLQRSEIEDQVSAAAAVAAAAAKHQQQGGERRGSENLPDLSALGLMGLPGLNVMPSRGSGGGSGGAAPNSAASYARELSRERERDRERERERELSRQYGSQSRGSSSGSGSAKSLTASQRPGAASPYSAAHYAKHQASAYNKRFLESLPAGIDLEAFANGLLQKSVNKSPRFEDFFPGPGQDMSELFANPDASAAAAAAAYAPPGAIRESPLMKIKLEQQHATELPHED